MQKTERDEKVLRTRGNIFAFICSIQCATIVVAFDYIHPRLSCFESKKNNNNTHIHAAYTNINNNNHRHPGKNAFRVRQSATCNRTMYSSAQKKMHRPRSNNTGRCIAQIETKRSLPSGSFPRKKHNRTNSKKERDSNSVYTECVIVVSEWARGAYINGSKIKWNRIGTVRWGKTTMRTDTMWRESLRWKF